VPGVRTLISIPAGIGNMNIIPFLIYSTIGTTLWVLLLTYAGFALGQNYKVVETYIDPISKVVVIVVVVAFAGFVIFKLTKSKTAK
jgi:membrane protein DedA with SNARE-associated domain